MTWWREVHPIGPLNPDPWAMRPRTALVTLAGLLVALAVAGEWLALALNGGSIVVGVVVGVWRGVRDARREADLGPYDWDHDRAL